MSLSSFIRRECANYSVHQCRVLNGQPCAFFKEKLLKILAKQTGEYESLAKEYRNIDAYHEEKIRRCECGATLPPRARYCESCKKKHRKESTRRAVRKSRSQCKQLSENGNLQAVDIKGFAE